MKKLFLGFLPITILSAIGLLIIITTFDPFKAEGTIKILFFTALGVFSWGCGAITFFILSFFGEDKATDALRRGFFVAFFLMVLVFLRKMGILSWPTGFAPSIFLMLIEFLIYKNKKITVKNPEDF